MRDRTDLLIEEVRKAIENARDKAVGLLGELADTGLHTPYTGLSRQDRLILAGEILHDESAAEIRYDAFAESARLTEDITLLERDANDAIEAINVTADSLGPRN